MNFRIDNLGRTALISYAILATVLAVVMGGCWYRVSQQTPRVVTKTRVVKQKERAAPSNNSAAESAAKAAQKSAEAELSSYKSSEQKLKNTAIQYAKILQNYSPSVTAKRAALKKVATPEQVDQLAPTTATAGTQTKATAYEIEWNTITAMIQPGAGKDALVSVHMTYSYSYDSSHTQYSSVLLARFDRGLVRHSQMFTAVTDQAGNDQ
ncbi:hypothetical protein [Lacticaseibacillus porcinae]|uniref:hypothetical protein n=1 Tax=Lacticaseibacillus porcinae TaxID=1123687 RepID=UPI001CDCA065|nr:hypothetical protein [Lacticaseibacillus porcinae]